jgi:cytidylate kinase
LGDVDVADVSGAEQRRSLLQRLLDASAPGAVTRTRAPEDDSHVYVTVDSRTQSLRNLIREAIDETAAEGNVVIVAHAASHSLAAQPGVLRVLITGSPEQRAQRQNSSRDAVAESDKARAAYLRRFYGIESELPTHYDLVINTDKLSAEQATDLIVAVASGVSASRS